MAPRIRAQTMMTPYVAKTAEPCKTIRGQFARGLKVKLPALPKLMTAVPLEEEKLVGKTTENKRKKILNMFYF